MKELSIPFGVDNSFVLFPRAGRLCPALIRGISSFFWSISPFFKGVWGFRSLLVHTGEKTCEKVLTDGKKYDKIRA